MKLTSIKALPLFITIIAGNALSTTSMLALDGYETTTIPSTLSENIHCKSTP